MLTIQNIDKLIGQEIRQSHWEYTWEVVNVLGSMQPPYEYRIQLSRFNTIYDPMTFTPHKRLAESKTIILEREQKDGHYKMYNPTDNTNSLNLDISLMDTQNKLIAGIEFIM